MPHALSDMSSSPAQKPGSPAGKELLDKGMRKFKIVHRILQYEDALIKPGEDARDLRHRTQYRRGNTTRSPTATPRLYGSRRAGTSISSDYSATSCASNGSNSTTSGSSNSSSSSASLARRTDALRIQHSDLDCSTRQQSRYRSDANTSYIFHASEDNVSETTPVPEAAATASTAITSPPHPGIDHAAPGMQPLHCPSPASGHTDTTLSNRFITGPPLGSPQIIPHDPIASMLPPSVIRSDTAPLPTHQSFDPTFYSIPRSTASSVVAMSRESSSQGVAGGKNDTRSSPYENNNEDPDNDTIEEQSEPASPPRSNEHQPTPPSGDEDNDDYPSSEHDDSDGLSDDSHDSQEPLQRDFLESILRPVKQYFFQRLMVYIANDRSLGIPLSTTSLFGCTSAVKSELPEPLASIPLIPKRSVSQDCEDYKTLATAPKETPASADPGRSSGRASGKRPYASTNGGQCHASGSSSLKRKIGGASPSDGSKDGDESDDEGEQRGGPKQRRSPSPHHSPKGRRIACPYFKRNPRSPPRAHACFQNGFKDITKMKEHLERVHDCSIRCPRCFYVFKKTEEVNAHLRADQMCVQVQEQPLDNGYTAAQADVLKGRMRNVPTEEKWKIIWKVLFPTDPDNAIPPPWWVDRDQLQGLDFFGRYESFMRDDLPSRITQGLMNFVDQVFYTDILGGRVEAVIQDCLEQSYSHFRALEADGQETVPRQREAGPPQAGAPEPVASTLAGPSTATQNLAVPHMAGPVTIDPSFTLFDTATNSFQPGSWQAPRVGSTQVFGPHSVPQGQPVAAPHVGHPAPPALATYHPTQPELARNVNDMDNSFLNVEHDVAAAHTPVGRSPDGQWDSMDDAAALFDPGFDDLSSGYHASFPGGNHSQGGFSGRN